MNDRNNKMNAHPVKAMASLICACLLFGCKSDSGDDGDSKMAIVGAWVDSVESDSCVIFFADGRVLFTYLLMPKDGVVDWQHIVGTWKRHGERRYEITSPFPPFPATDGPPQKDIFALHPHSEDILLSPHGGSLYRVGSECEVDALSERCRHASGGDQPP